MTGASSTGVIAQAAGPQAPPLEGLPSGIRKLDLGVVMSVADASYREFPSRARMLPA